MPVPGPLPSHHLISGLVRQGIAPGTPDEEITSDIWGLPEHERPVRILLFVDEVAELFLSATEKDEQRRDEIHPADPARPTRSA